MMLKFIVDTQLPPKLSELLTTLGFDAIHTTFFPAGHLLMIVRLSRLLSRKKEL